MRCINFAYLQVGDVIDEFGKVRDIVELTPEKNKGHKSCRYYINDELKAMIKDYVKDNYGVNVHTSYIAQVKRMCGLDMGENYNKSKKENPEVKKCPQEKVEYIKDALRYYGLI